MNLRKYTRDVLEHNFFRRQTVLTCFKAENVSSNSSGAFIGEHFQGLWPYEILRGLIRLYSLRYLIFLYEE